jgi:hypothetical protein
VLHWRGRLNAKPLGRSTLLSSLLNSAILRFSNPDCSILYLPIITSEEYMTVNRSYANDLGSFGGSAELKQFISTAFDAAFDHLNKQRNLVPMALTKEQGKIAISVIVDDTNRSTEEVARTLIQPRSQQIEMYAVCYAAQAQQKPAAKPLQVIIVIAAERGVPYGYRVAQAYQRKLLAGITRTNTPFLMGRAEQFLADT